MKLYVLYLYARQQAPLTHPPARKAEAPVTCAHYECVFETICIIFKCKETGTFDTSSIAQGRNGSMAGREKGHGCTKKSRLLPHSHATHQGSPSSTCSVQGAIAALKKQDFARIATQLTTALHPPLALCSVQGAIAALKNQDFAHIVMQLTKALHPPLALCKGLSLH